MRMNNDDRWTRGSIKIHNDISGRLFHRSTIAQVACGLPKWQRVEKKCTHVHAHVNDVQGKKGAFAIQWGCSRCESAALFMHICTFKFRFSQQCNKERLWTTRVCIMDKSLSIHTHTRIIRFCKLRTRTISELFRWFWKTVHRRENDK